MKKTDKAVVEACRQDATDGLKYWINFTSITLGTNYALNLLLHGMALIIEKVATPEQIDNIEKVIARELEASYQLVREKARNKGQDPEGDDNEVLVADDSTPEDIPGELNEKLDKLFIDYKNSRKILN